MRFLFCTLGTHGFVHPAVGLAQALRQRGHQVAFATHASFGPMLEQQGLERIPRGDQDGPSFELPAWFKPLHVAMQFKHVEHALARFSPDVLVAHPMVLGALLSRERHGLPLACLGMAGYLWPYRAAEDVEPSRRSLEALRDWRHTDMVGHYNAARALLKLAPVSTDWRETPFLGDLFMLRTVPDLVDAMDVLPPQVHVVGSCLWEPAESNTELDEWLARQPEAPILYVQQGRTFGMPSFWPVLTRALTAGPVRVVADSGRMDASTDGMPADAFVRPHVPQASVLRRARAVVSSGNSTAVLGALTHGLPSLLIPGGGEQPDLSEEMARAGVALSRPVTELAEASLVEAVEQVLHAAPLRRRAEALRKAFARLDEARPAVQLLETLALTRRPVLRAGLEPAARERRVG